MASFDVVATAPGAVAADQFGRQQAVERLGQGVVVGVSFATNGCDRVKVCTTGPTIVRDEDSASSAHRRWLDSWRVGSPLG
jgi:hypothetical protein